jgi:rSAM/selenodomain-associated transferase 1
MPARRPRAVPQLVVFARKPVAGRGKRRLARGAGELTALSFQRRQFARVLHRLAGDPRWRTWVALTPDRAAADAGWLARYTPAGARVHPRPQGRGDVGQRMARALTDLPPGPVVLVGTDVPGLSAAHVAAAFDRLRACDCVLGPAADGGFWLIGLARRRPVRVPFDGVRWSHPETLADTRADLRRKGMSWAELETLADVDGPEDLQRDRSNV